MATLLERLKTVFDELNIPFRVGVYAPTPAPDLYAVATPLGDTLDVYADGKPLVEIEEVRVSVFCRGSYVAVRDKITRAIVDADITITDRVYVGYEDDTRFHHYAVDAAAHHHY